MEYKKTTALAPGTCGELVQGSIDGQDFLITCPIDMWSRISVYQGEKNQQNNKFTKAQMAIESALINSKSNNNIYLTFERSSDLPIGKGMGSSTADIAAAYKAASLFLDIDCTEDQIADAALAIEPSDGLMYPGICLFDHREGRWRELLGEPPALDIVILDPGGTVDTLEFNGKENLHILNKKKEPEVTEALHLVKYGIMEKDPEKIGRGATISSVANQEILYKPYLDKIIRLARDLKAMGVNIAHSGTVMGILLADTGPHPMELAEYLQKKYPTWTVYTSKIISGGIKVGT
jgi:L-threonine kinase